jgi:hypothetical protein
VSTSDNDDIAVSEESEDIDADVRVTARRPMERRQTERRRRGDGRKGK